MPSAVVRLPCEARSSSRSIRDAATSERPFYWRGSSVAFQLALLDQGAFLLAAAVGTIVVEVKRLDALALDDSLMRKEYLAAACDATFTANDWGTGTKALLTAEFTVNEAAILPGTYRLIVSHEDGAGNVNVHLSSELAVLDPQTGSEGIDPPPIAWTYLDSVPMIRWDVPQELEAHKALQARKNLFLGSEESIVTVLDGAALPLTDAAHNYMTLVMKNNVARTLIISDNLPGGFRCRILRDAGGAVDFEPGGDLELIGGWSPSLWYSGDGVEVIVTEGGKAVVVPIGRGALISPVQATAGGGVAIVDGKPELVAWDETDECYRILRIQGAGAAKKIYFSAPL